MNAPAAPPFPLNPTVGQRWLGWMWNGAQWVFAPTTGISVNVQVFNQSAPYIATPGLISAVVEAIGGGGGGGSVGSASAAALGGGGGGGAGGYSRKAVPAALVMGGVVVTVGLGGGGAATPESEGVSFPGTLTSFGALCLANGGLGAQGNNSQTVWGQAGLGGAPGIGDIASGGNPGLNGTSQGSGDSENLNASGGAGGGGPWGGGGLSALIPQGVSVQGFNGTGPGSGGSGAAINDATSPGILGGDGAPGICVVTEYCFNDASEAPPGGPFNVAARVEVRDGGQWGPRGPHGEPFGGDGFDD